MLNFKAKTIFSIKPNYLIIIALSYYRKQNELLIGDVKTLTVRVEVENKAQDAAYPGKVMVTYPSLIDYAYSEVRPYVKWKSLKYAQWKTSTARSIVE